MISKIIISVALLCMFLFAGSASAAVDFPVDEAGISAYVKANSSINLNDSKPAFTSIERETSDYIVGTVALSLHSEEQYPHVYVSNDGWIVAYYPKNRPSSWILPWGYYSGGPISITTLGKAVEIVTNTVNGTTNGLKYYDFRYPNASKMMIIVESTSSKNFFNVTIPSSFSMYAVDWSHYCSDCVHSYNEPSYAYLDGISFSYLGNCDYCKNYGSFNTSMNFMKGVEHKITITAQRDTHRDGLVLEYAE